MTITVKLFAVLRDKAGVPGATLDLPAGATAADAAAAVGDRYPAAKGLIAKAALAVNHEYARPDRPLADGDEVALIPAVSGGAVG